MEYLDFYCRNEAINLKQLVNSVLAELHIKTLDREECYSIANTVLFEVWKDFHKRPENFDFKIYFRMCLKNRLKTELTAQNRIKRQCDKNTVSIYDEIEDGLTLGDVLSGSQSVEEILFPDDEELSERTVRYLAVLPKKEKMIARYLMDGKSGTEIAELMGLTRKRYEELLADMRSYERARLLS